MIIFAVFISQTLCMYIVAIDPDVDKSGVAILDTSYHRLSLMSLSFPELVEYLMGLQGSKATTVCVEAGWKINSNWHIKRYDSKQSACAKGNSTGRNHEVGRKMVELCEYWKIPCKTIKPLRKCWKGKDGKITHNEIKSVLNGMNIKCPARTNQEERDATLIAITYGR